MVTRIHLRTQKLETPRLGYQTGAMEATFLLLDFMKSL